MENKEKERLKELDNRMYILNANISALIHIQKLKSLEEAKGFLSKINGEIGKWIKELRELYENQSKEKKNE